MSLFMNFGFAWITVILALILSVVFIIRILSSKSEKYKSVLSALNKYLRKYHKQLGVLIIFTGLIHGLFSSTKVWSFNLGTVSWLLLVLLCLTWVVRRYLSKYSGWMFYHRALTLLFILSIVIHVVDVGGIQVQKVLFARPTVSVTQTKQKAVADSFKNDSSETDSKKLTCGEFKEGVFEGEAQGFRQGLKVSIEIKNNAIINIRITDHNEENPRFYELPMETIPQEIIDSQNTEVDIVSGATFTSIGIINAVNDALSKALISGKVPDMQDLPKYVGHGRH